VYVKKKVYRQIFNIIAEGRKDGTACGVSWL